MKIKFIILLLLVFVLVKARGQNEKQEWLADAHFLYDSLKKNHADLFHHTKKKIFDQKFNQLLNDLPGLNKFEVFLRMKQFVSLAGDGHTFIVEPSDYHLFPLSFFEFPDGIRVTGADQKYAVALGKKLIAINGTPLKKIMDSLNTIISTDESTTNKMKDRMWQITTPEHLYAFHFIKNIDSAVFKFEDAIHPLSILVKSVPKNSNITWVSAFNPDPLFMQNQNGANRKPLWWRNIHKDIFYFNFQGYPDWEEMKNICDSMYKQLSIQKEIKKIIIDMRSNGGGNFDKGLRIVLPTFLNLNSIHPGIKYYVLIGRSTFSAGMSNAVHLRDCLKAITVGEPTGAKPNGYQELKGFVLPNLKVFVGCSTVYYTFQNKNTDGVLPDKLIAPDFSLYQKGRDPVVEWILRN